MKLRQLGKSDLRVSEISLGSWLTYGSGVEKERAAACVERAFEVGINFIDTANIYAHGAAETFLGEVLHDRPRSSYVLATKLFFPMTASDRGLSAKQIRKQLDASLQRLRTDYVDLYQCHRYDNSTPLEETMDALSTAVKEGKTRYIGFSEWSADQIRASQKTDGVQFISSQPQYSMLWRAPEKEVIPLCAKTGIGQIVWSPLAQGVLTGKYLPGQRPAPGTRAASDSMGGFMGGEMMSDETLGAVQELRPIAAELGCTLSQLALAWVLREPNVSSAITGASRPEQVAENAVASEITLTPDALERIDQVLGRFVARS